jgi:hypothetical protein
MSGLLDKISKLTDEQLQESCDALVSADTDDLRFVREAMMMERERRELQAKDGRNNSPPSAD